jgi:hypothetical protein
MYLPADKTYNRQEIKIRNKYSSAEISTNKGTRRKRKTYKIIRIMLKTYPAGKL